MLKFSISTNNNLNIDNLKDAIVNYALSRQKDEGFLILFDDIKFQNNINSKDGEISDILKKFAIDTEQKIYQSDQLKIYQKFARKLIENRKAFICFCSDDSDSCINSCINLTQQDLKNKIESNKPYKICLIDSSKEAYSFTILNRDKNPSSIFSYAIDNMVLGVTEVISTDINIEDIDKIDTIYKALDFNQDIKYTIIGSITDKKDINITIESLLKEGYLPDAIINYIVTLIHPTPNNIFYLPDIVKWLDLNNLFANPSKFNIDELKVVNQEHLKKIDSKKLSNIFGFSDNNIGDLLKLYLKKYSTISQLEQKLNMIFSKKDCSKNIDNIKLLSDIIFKAPIIDDYNQFEQYILNKISIDKNELNNILHILLGIEKKDGIELKEIYPFIKSYILEVTQCQ